MQKTPEIRFEGFEGSWEQKKLGDVINLYDNKTTVENEFPVLSSTMNGIYLQKEYFNQEVSKVSNIGYKVVPKGYITYRSMSDTDIFRFNVQNIIDFGIVSPAYPVFCGEKNVVDNSFLTYQMNWSNNFLKQLVMSKEGGTRYALSFSKLSKMHVDTPSLSEQTKIGEYFAQLDNAITLNQRKAEQYKTLKKYMLQKMFPKNGEKVPEIRFEGFTDAWEQRKVSELLEERNEQAPMSDEYPLMAFIANEGVAPKGERYDRSSLVNDTKNKLYKKTEFGDFIYSSNNLETGSIGLNKYGNASISPVYSIFKPTGIADSDFIGRRFVRRDFIDEMVRWRQGVVYGQWKIHESDFMKIEVAVPSIEEQRKIGKYLDQLDNAITLHQRKSDEFKTLKKYMLQKMFPKQ